MNLERALVTNVTSPLGSQLARELAAHGHPLVLVASDQGALEQIGATLGNAFNIELRLLVGDLRQPEGPAQIFDDLAEDGMAIDILVNNIPVAGPGAFLETSLEQDLALVRAQLEMSLRLLKLFLGPMAQRQQGRVLNLFAQRPSAMQQASASFVRGLGDALLAELAPLGIAVKTLCFDGAALDSAPVLEELARTAYRGLMAGGGLINFEKP